MTTTLLILKAFVLKEERTIPIVTADHFGFQPDCPDPVGSLVILFRIPSHGFQISRAFWGLTTLWILQKLYGDVNKVDTLVAFLAENTRPHGFALAETQFQIFILNASRRLFSDRFFSTSCNAETYTQYGIEQLRKRGMRDALADNFTEGGLDKLLRDKATGKFRIANAFDPWTQERKGYELTDSYNTQTLHGGLFN